MFVSYPRLEGNRSGRYAATDRNLLFVTCHAGGVCICSGGYADQLPVLLCGLATEVRISEKMILLLALYQKSVIFGI